TSQTANCPQRHLAIWLDLTQKDIDNWEDPSYVAKVSQPYDPGCLAAQTADTVCGKFLTDPITLTEIAGGNATISGAFTQQSAQDLATGINSGSLPVDLVALDVTQVSATLGAESVKLSLAAGLLGLAIVVLFMIIYYRMPGLLASLALLFYAGAVLAVFKVVPVTLTLAGITGFILSVGMAVDANVLIFERFKEEVRAGRTITAAVDAAVRRAWPAIRDSNTSTIITCVILAFIGPAVVQGFAKTLAIGVVISLISSIIVTHNLLAIVPGIVSMATKHFALGIDFAGGTELTVAFANHPTLAQVQGAVDAEGVNGSVISTGGDGYIIRYPPLTASQVTGIQTDLKNRLGPTNVQQILVVGGTIAGETIALSALAVVVASLAILMLLAIRFRNVPGG